MCVLIKFRICMSRKHLTMRIDIYPLIFCLLQKLFKVVKVMPRNNDERSLFNSERHFYRCRCSICLSICLIEKFHTSKIYLSHLHCNRKKSLLTHIITEHTQCLYKKVINCVIPVTKHICMIRICRHSLMPKRISDLSERISSSASHIFLTS